MSALGSYALLLALALAGYSFLFGLLALAARPPGWERLRETARRAGIASFGTVLIAAVVLVTSAFRNDFSIPFARALAARAKKYQGDKELPTPRRWTMVTWAFLSLGIPLGAHWAYYVLGWGGYWGWDPVENASLLPWLTGTAFLHSVMM